MHYHSPRSQILFMKTHAPALARITFGIFFPWRILNALVRIAGSGLVGRKNVWPRTRAILAGCYDGIMGQHREFSE